MHYLDDLRIRTKALLPIAVAVLAMLTLSIMSGLQLSSFTTRSSEIIEKRDKALIDLLQAARHVNRSLNIPLRSVLYDGDDKLLRYADETLAESIDLVGSNLRDAAALIPERGVELEAIAARYQTIRDDLKKVLAQGKAVQSLMAGRDLTGKDLDILSDATRAMHRADEIATTLVDGVAAIVKQVSEENTKRANAMQAEADTAMKRLVAGGVLATLLALTLSLWIVSSKISAPLTRLATRMQAVANGDLDGEVEGVERRDEVGAMAQAVQVFRTNAIERQRIEQVAEQQREIAETERREAAAQRTQVADERAAAARREAEQLARASGEREALAAEQAHAMRHIGEAIRALADKNLTHRIDERLHEDYEPLRAEFNGALDQLSQAFVEVASAAESVNHGAQEITAATNDLARRTEQQATNIEESASSLNEITTTVHKTAAGAASARDSVVVARGDAAKGVEVINLTTEAMSRIEASAKKVTEIIGVIDEIAFQTNLLALNAGVEAARAGEAGRGFAVVASEVRALAQRAADAAKEVKELISASGQEVQHGVALVAQTGDALSQIGQTVIKIDEIVCTIANDAQSQASGLTEVNGSVRQVDKMTQQNAAMAEEATAASVSLSRESERLSRLVAQFAVSGARAESSPRADSNLRAELRRAAPHAFAGRQTEKPPVAESQPSRPLRVASGGRGAEAVAVAQDDDDWKSF
jgi:methyl-accepting chemotaxis protein